MQAGSLRRAAGAAPTIGALLVAVTSVTVRGAEGPRLTPLAIESVDGTVCFSAAQLEAQVRRLAPGIDVQAALGAEGGVVVAVRRRPVEGAPLEVELRRHAPPGSARTEQHTVPTAGTSCRVLTETVAAMVARAITPLGAPRPAPPATPPPAPAPPSPPAPPPAEPAPPVRVVLPPVVVRADRPPPALLLDAALRVSLTPDGVAPGIGGLFSLAWRRSDVLLFVGAGVEQPLYVDSPSSSAWQRRIPLLLGVGYDVSIPSGAIRLDAAALLDLWRSSLLDPAGQVETVWVHGGVHASLAYHLRALRWLDLFLGVDVEYVFRAERWVSSDGSLEIRSPSTWIDPKVGASLNFF